MLRPDSAGLPFWIACRCLLDSCSLMILKFITVVVSVSKHLGLMRTFLSPTYVVQPHQRCCRDGMLATEPSPSPSATAKAGVMLHISRMQSTSQISPVDATHQLVLLPLPEC